MSVATTRRGARRGPGFHRRQKPIASAIERLNESGIARIIRQGLPQFFHRAVQADVKNDEGVFGPEAFLQLLARDDFTGAFQQHRQNLEGLILQFDLDAGLAQLHRGQIHFVKAEAENRRIGRGHFHRAPSNSPEYV